MQAQPPNALAVVLRKRPLWSTGRMETELLLNINDVLVSHVAIAGGIDDRTIDHAP